MLIGSLDLIDFEGNDLVEGVLLEDEPYESAAEIVAHVALTAILHPVAEPALGGEGEGGQVGVEVAKDFGEVIVAPRFLACIVLMECVGLTGNLLLEHHGDALSEQLPEE